jgi:epoxyqueuosine reductase
MKRARPAELVAGTRRVISARLAYLPAATLAADAPDASSAPHDWRARERARLDDPQAAVVSIYARGRDYHKVLRNRLQTLAERIEREIGAYGYRVFTDSAPVLEVELAQKAGVGWRGKHTLLLQRDAGSLFFLGEIYVDVALPTDAQTAPDVAPETPGAHCGSCTRCSARARPARSSSRIASTRALHFVSDDRAEGQHSEPLRPLIGNRVYGCDDCQLVCPWNKFAQAAPVADFDVRHGLDRATLVELFGWDAETFDTRMQGSAIRRIGHESWLRNLAVGLGNALRAPAGRLALAARDAIVAALRARADDPSPVVREHVEWAARRMNAA